jgi:hypothetical protein
VVRTAAQIRKSQYHKARRLKERQAQQILTGTPTKKIIARRIQQATPIFTPLNVRDDLETTTTAWLGLRIRKPDRRAYTLTELRALHMKFLLWDGR